MKGFPAGHDQELFFGLAVEDPKGPDKHFISNFQGANLNVITNVSAFLAEHDVVEEAEAEQEEPVATPARYGALALGPMDAYIQDWIADGGKPLTQVKVVLAERDEPVEVVDLDDQFIPGNYNVVPIMPRRDRDAESDYEAAKFRRPRHHRRQKNRDKTGHNASSQPAEFVELQDVAVG